jgi:hypothetical protein
MPARKIILLRHAEKPDDTAGILGVDAHGRPDPRSLSVRGWQRTGALVGLFAPRGGRFVDSRLASPGAIFAASAQVRSARSLHTVETLAQVLGLPVRSEFGSNDDVPRLVAAAEACDGAVLICWRHDAIAAIARAVLRGAAAIPEWDEKRYDVTWVCDRADNGWRFGQMPQRLLPGDSDTPIA